jgi:hypothetical protein
MAIKIRAQVLLCPHRRHLVAAAPEASWPRPANVEVQLTPAGGSTAGPISLGATNRNGLTSLSPELELGMYQVRIPGYDFTADLDLTAAQHQKTVEVRLAPRGDRCLVLLELIEAPTRRPVSGATIHVSTTGAAFTSLPSGFICATAPEGDVTLQFDPAADASGARILPADPSVAYTVQASGTVIPVPVYYWPAIQISVTPTVTTPAGNVPLAGTCVTVEYRGSPGVPGFSQTTDLGSGTGPATFEFPFAGVYVVTVEPPPDVDGLPIKNPANQVNTRAFSSGGQWPVNAAWQVIDTEPAEFVVMTPQNQPLIGSLALQIVGPDNMVQSVTGTGTSFTADVPKGEPLQIRLDATSVPPQIGTIPLTMAAQEQQLVTPPATNSIQLDYLYSIIGQISDEHGQAVPGVLIDIYDSNQTNVGTVVADQLGSFVYPLSQGGTYFVAPQPAGGNVAIRERVDVHSGGRVLIKMYRSPPGGGGGGGGGGDGLTDLSAYPVLTEEISTTGPPAPAGGGGGSGGAGAGYGQTVDQVMRDVLGWRPSGDLAGFQAALTGAFELRQVEGHTEWAWQQRGYAVQADMGALTGAQASIYARAKGALDQILPLLAGLTTLNPALYPPQDLEAMRTVITTELNELVSELALSGGPRIQRVDELFGLLTGDPVGSRALNPDLVQGNLGTLRDRFGLTVSEIDTVDDERIVTNFRIVVEQVLTLQASWSTDRELLSGVNSRTALGTILIWLSRGLEAVGESVDDLNFALDSVYVDAAQRQVIELDFALMRVTIPKIPLSSKETTTEPFGPKEPQLLLSDLLDWVTRASREEGPRIIQDAGKDGVLAFAPVLDKLRKLIYATRDISRTSTVLPPGMRTPRVRRALEVLADQLDTATDLARKVKRDVAPALATALVTGSDPDSGRITVTLTGTNFRRTASVVLIPENRQDLPELTARHAGITPPGSATASFRDPRKVADGDRVRWLAVLTNDDGAESNAVAIQYQANV